MKRRYIDLDKAISLFHMTFFYSEKPISILECVPLEDVAPVIHAHWYHKPHVWGVDYCSNCDFELHINDTKYCPSCGAKMDEEVENG